MSLWCYLSWVEHALAAVLLLGAVSVYTRRGIKGVLKAVRP